MSFALYLMRRGERCVMSRPSLSSLTTTPSPLLVLCCLNAFLCLQGRADNLLCG